jgi:hypothetical protein
MFAPMAVTQVQVDEQTHGTTDLDELRNRVFNLIGSVRAAEVSKEWSESDIAIHLRGLAAELNHHRESLLVAGRKLVAMLPEAPKAAWSRKRTQFLKELEKLEDRVSIFDERTARLKSWQPINERLSALRSAIDRLAENSESGKVLGYEFESLASALREQFATRTWEPLGEVALWESKIGQLEERVQRLQYDSLITFLRQRQELVRQLGWAAEQPAPQWRDGMQNSFETLRRWTLWTIERGLALIESMKTGQNWRDPEGTKISCTELHRRCKNALTLARENASEPNVANAASLMARLFSGFKERFPLPITYNDPDSPLDFRALEAAFRAGLVMIEVRPISEEKR